jgi:hypothetical protein
LRSGQRTDDHTIREVVARYCSEPRLALSRTVVLRSTAPERHLSTIPHDTDDRERWNGPAGSAFTRPASGPRAEGEISVDETITNKWRTGLCLNVRRCARPLLERVEVKMKGNSR